MIVHHGLFPCCSLGAVGPNQYLVLILAPGLPGEQVEVQDFVSNEEIVNPSLAQSCCFVFIKMVLTTASSWGGWVREERQERASCLHHLTRHAAFKPHFSVAAFEALH